MLVWRAHIQALHSLDPHAHLLLLGALGQLFLQLTGRFLHQLAYLLLVYRFVLLISDRDLLFLHHLFEVFVNGLVLQGKHNFSTELLSDLVLQHFLQLLSYLLHNF